MDLESSRIYFVLKKMVLTINYLCYPLIALNISEWRFSFITVHDIAGIESLANDE